jgi:L-methionine (R)-S-oxide reductase
MLTSKNKEKIYIKCIESVKSTSKSNKLKFISKLLFESFDSWIFCGFYFQENDKLLVSEYSANKIPCSPIEFNGVCGTAILKNKILNIEDVNTFQGHIVCDNDSKSELCIPFDIDDIKYVLDVDSNIYNAFCDIDEKYLVKIIKEI